MQRLCKTCGVYKKIEDFYVADRKSGRRELHCKKCRMAKRRTPERKEYINKYRAAKKLVGDYGKCKLCDKNLGRNENYDRKPPTGNCADCLKMDNHWNWTGGKTVNADGYIIVRYAPRKTMLEHRYVMERHLGRSLLADETVHHLNGDRQDNRIENLELWVGAPTRGIRTKDALKWAEEIIERYKND